MHTLQLRQAQSMGRGLDESGFFGHGIDRRHPQVRTANRQHDRGQTTACAHIHHRGELR